MCEATVSAQARRILDAGQRGHQLRRNLARQLHQLLELADQLASDHLDLALAARVRSVQHARVGDHQAVALAEGLDLGAVGTLDQHLDGAVRQLQQLQHAGDGADRVQVAGGWLVDVRAALRDEQDLAPAFHRDVERAHGLLAADEQRNHHVRKHHHVAQRQHRQLDEIVRGLGGLDGLVGHRPAGSERWDVDNAKTRNGSVYPRCRIVK